MHVANKGGTMHINFNTPLAHFRCLMVAGATLLLFGCATGPKPPDPQVLVELAPTGKLRTAHILANPILATRNPSSGELRGITIDLA